MVRKQRAEVESRPLVSVIVPAYNAATTLERTLASALAQTYCTLELVVVDDGSTDTTREIAARFARADPRLRVVSKPNGGLASAWNRGVAETRGAWIAPLDGDDLWHPTKIEKQMGLALTALSPPGFVYCFSRIVDADDVVLGDVRSFAAAGRALNRHVWRNFVGNGSACLFHRTAVEAAGGYDERRRVRGVDGSDDLILQLAIAGERDIACVPEYLVGYRLGGGLTADSDRMRRAWENVKETLRAGDFPVAPSALRWASGGRAFNYAEAAAWRGRWLQSAGHLLRAARLDPRGTAALLRWRLARKMRAALAPATSQPRHGFFDVDPKQPWRAEAGAEGAAWHALQRLEQSRLAALQKLDGAAPPGDRGS
jgi:glycosyltransferase involved in cell wall biosynthesis